MTNGSWSTSNNFGQQVTISFSSYAVPVPQCTKCGLLSHALNQTAHPKYRLLCGPCIPIVQRMLAIEHANEWLEAAFHAVGPDGRKKLHRALVAAFHPDQGGDEQLMVALNAVRERFP